MSISLKPKHVQRYRQVAALIFKYGRGDFMKELGANADFEIDGKLEPTASPGSPKPEELATDLEKLGPTFIKLGQVLSTRADLLPPAYLEALARLQDNVEPFPFEEASAIIASELGVRISKAFLTLDPEPLAAASLGQVHRATLRDGRQVAVKVQRPNIREVIADDLEALQQLADLLDRHTDAGKRYGFAQVLEQFKKSLFRELDYQKEAQNLLVLRQHLSEFDRIVVPMPIEDYTTSRVLTMEFVTGRKITALSPLLRLDIDGAALAEDLFHAYLKQILVDGFFHADPHPGNVFITDDGKIGLLDLGQVAHVSPGLRDRLLKLVVSVSEGKGEETADMVMRFGQVRADHDPVELKQRIAELVAEVKDATVRELKLGRVMLELARLCGESGLRLPPELTVLAKTLLHLDEIGRALDPTFDPNASIRRNSAEIFRENMMKSATSGSALSTLLEAKEFVQKLPERVNQLLDMVTSNSLKVRVDAIDERLLIEGLQKIANRIALGLVLAALIVGAALLMQVPTRFRLFGYPGLAIVLFLCAAAGGAAMALQIVMSDRKKGRTSNPKT